ncbi:hypothetical protein DPMN_192574 [Dreissena polymorpha]|uniref:Uncharacterized protein n=1 Tax=Dreissena polymorpha TaxID=45954 RepID=A0A9D3Y4Y6_DREPO|nr:hypothetical protein DPMN_192574 [Dreissena polymorpha]
MRFKDISHNLKNISSVVSHYDAGGAPLRDPGSIGMNRGSTGMNRGSIGDDRDEPGKTGAPPGKLENSPGRTGNDRRGTGNNRDSTVAPPGPIQTPAELRQRPGECRYLRKQALCRHATGIHRGSAVALPATTGVKPGLLNRGTTGDNRGYAGASPG